MIRIHCLTFGLTGVLLSGCATKHAEQVNLDFERESEVEEETELAEAEKSLEESNRIVSTKTSTVELSKDIASLRSPVEAEPVIEEQKAVQLQAPVPMEIEEDVAYDSLAVSKEALLMDEIVSAAPKKSLARMGQRVKSEMKRKSPVAQPSSLSQEQSLQGALAAESAPVDLDSNVVPDRSSNGEQYTDYGVNPFVSTAEDAKSTFSVDVDTASYTIARRKLNEGKIPNYASVRVEEYINFFDYHYQAPTQESFAVHMEAMEHPFKKDKHVLRVGLQGKELSVENRPPLHLTFLVDVSGSMSSRDKLPLAKESMHMLVDTLEEGDTVALATYAGSIAKILDPTYGDDKETIHAAIDRLGAGGSTAMSSGLDLAYEMAWSSFEPGAENRVVVLSDGDANVGRTSWQDMLAQIKSYADRGVTMSTIGFGMGNYKDSSMEQLANKGDGNNFYIDSRAQAHRVFVEDFNSSMINIARDVKIQVEFNPEMVQSYRLLGYENRDIADKDFRNDRVDAGEVGSGHNVTALYELVLEDSYGLEDIATARLRYEKPGADSIATERSWTVDSSQISSKREVSDSLKIAFTAGCFAEILRRSPYASGISLDDLIQYGETAQRRGEKDDRELLDLMRKANQLGVGPAMVSR